MMNYYVFCCVKFGKHRTIYQMHIMCWDFNLVLLLYSVYSNDECEVSVCANYTLIEGQCVKKILFLRARITLHITSRFTRSSCRTFNVRMICMQLLISFQNWLNLANSIKCCVEILHT